MISDKYPQYEWLPAFINDMQYERVAEVGVWEGVLSREIARRCLGLTHLLLVDTWLGWIKNPYAGAGKFSDLMQQETYDHLREHFKGDNRIAFFRGCSVQAASFQPRESFDLVFIDACHRYESVWTDIWAWRPRVRPGGCLCGHDYIERHPGVIQAVDELVSNRSLFKTIWWTIL